MNNIKKQVKRKRNKIISFRATEKEADLLDKKVEISGLTKQDYIISSLISSTVSIKVDYRLEDRFSIEVFRLAKVIKKYGRLEDEDQEILSFLIDIYYEIKKEKAFSTRPKATLLLECILDKSILPQESNKYQTRRRKWRININIYQKK